MSRPIMLIDSQKCMNCKACIVACQQRNNVPYGHSRNWIRETPHPDAPTGIAFQPGACMHCRNAPCVAICPTGATYLAPNGTVLTDKGRCLGCGACVAACPYQARFLHPLDKVVDKCDYCGDAEPACVSVCPTGCRVFGDADDPASGVSRVMQQHKLHYLKPENLDPTPSLAYIGETVPARLAPFQQPAQPIDLLKPLSQGLSWVGGLTLVALGAILGKQLLERGNAARKTPETDKDDRQ